jgi:hypothetical protein
VLISSSTLSAAVWQPAPQSHSSEVAQSSRSQNGGAQAEASRSDEHTVTEDTQRKDALANLQRLHRSERLAAQDQQNSQQALGADAQTLPVTPFQALLSGLMPPANGLAANADLPTTAKTVLDQSLAKAPGDGLLNGNKAEASGKPGLHPVALDPAFQITKEEAGAAAMSQKLSDAQEAFSARVVERAGTAAAALNLRDAQAGIWAARFDTARPAANSDTQSAMASKKADAAGSPEKAAQPEQMAADSQTSADANADSGSDPRQRDTSGPGTARTSAGPDTAATAPQAAQNIQGSLLTPAPVAGNVAGIRASGPAKTITESGAPQLLEQQGEPGVRAGESVRNISLRLTNADQSTVQVRLSERGGELLVSVRTPDVSLTRGLRDGLPELLGKLEVNGYRAETSQPGGNGNSAGQDQGQGQHEGSHGHAQERNGNGPGSQPDQQRDRQQDEQTPKWVPELESSIQRSNKPWPVSPTP